MDFLQFGRPFIGHEQELILTLVVLMIANSAAGVIHSNEKHNFDLHKFLSQVTNKILVLGVIVPTYLLNKQITIIEANSVIICLMLLKELLSSITHIFKFNFKTYDSIFEVLKSKNFEEEEKEE